MKYKDVLEKLSVLRKFHTSNEYKDKVTFYRGKDNNNGELHIIRDDEMDVYNISDVELLSLSSKDGLVVHYGSLDERTVHSYRFDSIADVEVIVRG